MRRTMHLVWQLVLILFGIGALVPLVSAEEVFFPPEVLGLSVRTGSEKELAALIERWFGGQLAAMGEVPMWEGEPRSGNLTTVRLLFLPSFGHGTMLRLAISDSGEMTYVFKSLSGRGGYAPGKLAISEEGSVAPATAARIGGLLAEVHRMPPKAPKDSDGTIRMCMDGTQTVMEIAGKGDYTAIERHECEIPEGDALRRLIEAMNEVSGGKVVDPLRGEPITFKLNGTLWVAP